PTTPRGLTRPAPPRPPPDTRFPREGVRLPEPDQPKGVVGRELHGLRPLHRLLKEGNGLGVAAGEGGGKSQRRRHGGKEQGDIGKPADDEAALEGGGRL